MSEADSSAAVPAATSDSSLLFRSPSSYFRTRSKHLESFHYQGSQPIFSYYSKYLNPVVWKESERTALKVAVAIAEDHLSGDGRDLATNLNWTEIAASVGSSKTPMDCLMQYRNVDDPKIHSQPWNEDEIEALISYHRLHGNDWVGCAEAIGNGRTPYQCLSCYQQNVNNTLSKRDTWTEDEDSMLRRAVAIYGTDWMSVASCLEGRSATQCLQRWYRSIKFSSAKSDIKKGVWDIKEERLLFLAAIVCDAPTARGRETGERKDFPGWPKISEFLPTRDAQACREKWVNVMDPFLCRSPFSKEEDERLMELCKVSSEETDVSNSKFWSRIALSFPGRTDNQIYRRWKSLSDDATKEVYLEGKRLKKRYMPPSLGRNTKAKTENSVMRLPERGEAMDVYLYEAPQHQHRLATDDPELIDIRGASKSDSNSDPHSSRTIFEI